MRRLLRVLYLTILTFPGLGQQLSPAASPANPEGYKCGLPILSEALSAGNARLLADIRHSHSLKRAALTDTLTSPSGHFKIIYDANLIQQYDRNSNGLSDYLEFVMDSFDRAWEIEIDSLGFQPPLDLNGNERTTYQIFCRPLGSGLYGQTTWPAGSDIPSLPGFNYVTDIDINTSFSFVNYPAITDDPIVRDSLAIAVTAAHEFNHALQLTYRVWHENDNSNGRLLDLWFFESSATFMEEVVCDEVNDYLQYLDDWFAQHQSNIAFNSGLRIYGQSIFFLMLEDAFGSTITREMWEQVRQQRPVSAVGTVLQNKGSSFVDEWRRLAIWMYYSGNRAISGQFFAEGGFYPDVELQATSAYNGGEQRITSDELPPLSFQYFSTALTADAETSLELVPGGNDAEWKGAYFADTQQRFRNFAAGLPRIIRDLPDPSTANYVIVSGAWGDLASNNGSFFEVNFNETPVTAAPNIVRPAENIAAIRFLNVPDNATVQIFTANGQRIATVIAENGVIPAWNLLNSRGEPVGTGVYVYQVVSGDTKFDPGKLLIIR